MPNPTPRGTSDIFLLSVQEPHASRIAEGRKRWEFRQNPNFGKIQDMELRTGDSLFIIAMGSVPAITCLCLVGRILRGASMRRQFSDLRAECWREAGIHDSEGDRLLKQTILDAYATAVELTATPLPFPIPLGRIRHKYTNAPWSGKDFTPVTMLHRYTLDGMDVQEALARLRNEAG